MGRSSTMSNPKEKSPMNHAKAGMGLRERKKFKTQETIQRKALQIFKERGYENTTIDQIAEAAEISRGTFFHYFPTKADILLHDVFDNHLLQIYQAQPKGISPIRALRLSLQEVFRDVSEQDLELEKQREDLLREVPELQNALSQIILRSLPILAQAIAERLHRPKDDLVVRSLAGAVIGVSISIWSTIPIESENFMDLFMDHLDKGLEILETNFENA
jgi:AcrR family transcriptional regulator